MDFPYVPGYLAFREAPHFLQAYEKLKSSRPDCLPRVWLIDGNGILHTRGVGIASHLGVLLDIVTIGVAKNFYDVDGLHCDEFRRLFDDQAPSLSRGDYVPIVGSSGKVHGAALVNHLPAKNPIYVSIGHKISLETALKLVDRVSFIVFPNRFDRPI